MTYSYLESSQINIFPSTRRTYNQEFSARLMAESSIARIVNMLIDTQGFVITQQYSANEPFELNLHGYYFSVDQAQYITSLFDDIVDQIYAVIYIDTHNPSFYELYVPSEYSNVETYDSSKQYLKDDVVIYDGQYYICINDNGTTGTWASEDWQLVQNLFQGLSFCSGEPTANDPAAPESLDSYDKYYLLILQKISGQWQIPESSKAWLNIEGIDGGKI